MKVAVATGMTELDEKIREILENTKDMVVTVVNYREFFDKKDFDVAIISKRLMGDMNINQLFFLLKSKNSRIIYLTNDEDVNGIKKCFNYSINDILLDPVKPEEAVNLVIKPNSFSDITDIYLKYSNMELEKNDDGTPVKIIKEESNVQSNEGKDKTKVVEKVKVVEKIVEKPVKEIVYKTQILKKNIITFYNTDNSFLTADLITQLSVLMSKKVKQKILVLDFNTLFPVIDDFFGIGKEIDIESKYDVESSTSLMLMYNAIKREKLTVDTFTKFVTKHNKYKNVDIATGLYDLTMFEKIPNEYFAKIINIASQIYDTILINTNPDISLGSTFIPMKLSNNIIFMVEPNYTSIKNTFCVVDNLRISKDRMKFVIYNITDNSLDKETIEKLFENREIAGYIPEDGRKEEALNNQKPFIDTLGLKKASIEPYLSLLKKLDYILDYETSKTSFWNIFRKRG